MKNISRRDFLKATGAAVGGFALAGSITDSAEAAVQPLDTIRIHNPPKPPIRLSAHTHDLADRGISGEWGKALVNAGIKLEDVMDVTGMSEQMKYAHCVRLICENAPLRVLPFERVVGSATYRESSTHVIPVYGKTSVSHTTIGWEKALKIGYKGIRKEIEDRLRRGGLDEQGADLLKSMLICLDSADRWHKRHISLLKELIEKASGEEKTGYEFVLDNLRNVPENPPATFAEAVQSLWFMWAFQRLCGNWSGIGRIDEMLGSYLNKDLAEGKITLDEAREMIAAFWIHGTEWIGCNPAPGSGDAQFYQNIILGGVDANGKEVTNEVTYLVLDVVEELHISDFPIAVRLNSKSPEKLLRRMAEVQRYGGGIVAMYNEDVVIESLVKFGYPVQIARTFTNDGCWEALIPGKTCFSYWPFDTLERLQEAMGLNDPNQPIPDYATFDELFAAFSEKLANHINNHRNAMAGHCKGGGPQTTISMMVDGCIESGRGYFDRGPIYSVLATHAGGVGNTANSLLAVKKMVFDEKLLTFKELVEILRNDWKDQEALRRLAANRIPNYGNDNDEADAMVERVYDAFTNMVAEVKESHGILIPAGISTFGREIDWRPMRKATADGHHQGEILATNFSPSPGTDVNGPTAALKSYCKMDYTKLPNIGPLELKLHPASVEGEQGVKAMVGLMKSFVKLGGSFLHIDVMDSSLLLDAQRHPEKYPNLSVRIAGWSARFATLNKDWQDMIIQRTQHIKV